MHVEQCFMGWVGGGADTIYHNPDIAAIPSSTHLPTGTVSTHTPQVQVNSCSSAGVYTPLTLGNWHLASCLHTVPPPAIIPRLPPKGEESQVNNIGGVIPLSC